MNRNMIKPHRLPYICKLILLTYAISRVLCGCISHTMHISLHTYKQVLHIYRAYEGMKVYSHLQQGEGQLNRVHYSERCQCLGRRLVGVQKTAVSWPFRLHWDELSSHQCAPDYSKLLLSLYTQVACQSCIARLFPLLVFLIHVIMGIGRKVLKPWWVMSHKMEI